MRLALALALTAGVASLARGQRYDSPRTANVDAGGATVVRIDARAGLLRVTGKPGLTEVRVRGTARASSRGLLDNIRLDATRQGSEVIVKALMPEERDRGWNSEALLDLEIEIPATLAVDVDDTSGDLTVESVAAKIRIDDNSGNIRVRDAGGDVWISDNSGGIDVRGVKGSVEIADDGSGGIEIADVTGSVHVGRDGSGSIIVSHVGGDFTVERDGSGGIDYDDVKGRVDIPSRDRYRHRGRYR